MNMYGVNDGRLSVTLIFLGLSLVFGATGLLITQDSATKLLNETFFVLCRDEAGRSVTWRGPKGPLGLRTRPRVLTAAYGTSLLFNQTTADDAGTYTCQVDNEKKDFVLTIEAPLTFMDTDTEQTGIEGSDVILRCEVKGGKVTWLVEGGDISDKKYKIIADGLLIKNIERSDSKIYICKAVQQSTGIINDRKIKLRVLHKPTFPHPVYAKAEQAWGYINGTVNLTCTAMADPPPKFEWQKSKGVEKIGRILNVSSEVSVLQLFVNKAAIGDYKCIASNPYGNLEKIFTLEEGTKPNPPHFIELRGANSFLLDLGIRGPEETSTTPTAGAGVTASTATTSGMETKGYQVQYKRADTEKWNSKEFNISAENSYPLEGLRHDTAYAIRVATRNAAGLSDFTNTSIFTTLKSQSDSAHLPSHHVSLGLVANMAMMLIGIYALALW